MYGVNSLSDQENSSEKVPIDTTVPPARSRVLFTQPCEVVCGYYTPVPDGDTEAQQGGAPLRPGWPRVVNPCFSPVLTPFCHHYSAAHHMHVGAYKTLSTAIYCLL